MSATARRQLAEVDDLGPDLRTAPEPFPAAANTRRYVAHTLADHGRAAHLEPEARSFVEAALLYAEHWHPAAGEDGALAITVTDCESGEQHCITIDVDTGEVGPCAS